MSSVRQVYEMSINKDFDPNYEKVVEQFKEKFTVLHNNTGVRLSHTPKIHTIFEHLCQYLKMTNQTLVPWFQESPGKAAILNLYFQLCQFMFLPEDKCRR